VYRRSGPNASERAGRKNDRSPGDFQQPYLPFDTSYLAR
jgi:hypothetical protein